MISELIKNSRTVRRFHGDRAIEEGTLLKLIESARLSPCAVNAQRLRFRLITDSALCESIYPILTVGGALTAEQKPKANEHPTAYVIICTDREQSLNCGIDVGIAAQSIMLTACELGISGCMIRAFDPDRLSSLCGLGDYRPVLLLALGYAAEQVLIADSVDGSTRYYRDSQDRHVVPKLSLSELII